MVKVMSCNSHIWSQLITTLITKALNTSKHLRQSIGIQLLVICILLSSFYTKVLLIYISSYHTLHLLLSHISAAAQIACFCLVWALSI